MPLIAPITGFDMSGAHVEDLAFDQMLVRVYDAVQADLHGYDPLGYKMIPMDKSTVGGRFDGTTTDAYGYTYFGCGTAPLGAALWEVAFNKASASSGAFHLQLLEAEVEALAFQRVVVEHNCPTLMLTSSAECSLIGADVDICFNSDYGLTRQWASEIRSQLTRIHGIRYLSRRSGGQHLNLVTFHDRCSSARSYEPAGRIYKYSEPGGRRIFTAVAAAENIDLI